MTWEWFPGRAGVCVQENGNLDKALTPVGVSIVKSP